VIDFEPMALLAFAAAACAVLGPFLLLRRLALLSDAISHVVLFGIVLAFLVTRDLRSPLLIVGATLAGVATVGLVELLQRSRYVKSDAAIGLSFTAMFSAAVLLVSQLPRGLHLDQDSVLIGSPEYTTLDMVDNRLILAGLDFGPRALYVLGGVLLLNALFVAVFYKELKLATFDAGLAAALGFAPALLHYGLTTLVALTAVTVFDAVGSVLVVGLMVIPAATAYLLTDRLTVLILLSVAVAIVAALGGWWLAVALNSNTPGAVTTVLGGLFALAFLFAPRRGVLAQWLLRRRQRHEFELGMLAVHLRHHEGTPEEAEESRLDRLHEHLNWPPARVARVVRAAEARGLVMEADGRLRLTDAGHDLARQLLPEDGP
jgi:manganese/zinc/iron transport system permease protein